MVGNLQETLKHSSHVAPDDPHLAIGIAIDELIYLLKDDELEFGPEGIDSE
jgi:hypothetical protein